MFVLKTDDGDYVTCIELHRQGNWTLYSCKDPDNAMMYTNLRSASVALSSLSKSGSLFTIEEVECKE